VSRWREWHQPVLFSLSHLVPNLPDCWIKMWYNTCIFILHLQCILIFLIKNKSWYFFNSLIKYFNTHGHHILFMKSALCQILDNRVIEHEQKSHANPELTKWVMVTKMDGNIRMYTTYLRIGLYHTPVSVLRLRKYGIARLCIYFDVTSLELYKHSVKTR
jgi:hypothetical protein